MMLPIVFALLVLVVPRTGEATAQFVYKECLNTTNYTDGSQFQVNLNRILYRQLYNDGSKSIFSNQTEGEEPDKVYGLFLCRGDVSAADCQSCIDIASEEISKECPFKKEAIIWYDQCMIRYSNRSFFSTMETQPTLYLLNTENVTEPDKFTEILGNMFANLTTVATSIPSNQRYATNETNVGNFTKLYGMVQCTPDLSPLLCRNCLNEILSSLLGFMAGRIGGRVLTPSCNVRYELYPFLAEAPSDNGTDASNGSRGE
ncbi:hypothetical protein C3L33_06383, partial [Rhododendron williamsianum]